MNNKVITIIAGLMLFLSGSVIAQNNNSKDRGNRADTTVQKGKPEQAGKATDKVKEDGEAPQKVKAAANKGQGNAYGRDKGGLTGREFGRLRSEEARSKVKAQVDELEEEISRSEAELELRKEALSEARTRLETMKEDGDSSAEELGDKEQILQQVEDRLKVLEAEIESKRAKARSIMEQVLNPSTENSTDTETEEEKEDEKPEEATPAQTD